MEWHIKNITFVLSTTKVSFVNTLIVVSKTLESGKDTLTKLLLVACVVVNKDAVFSLLKNIRGSLNTNRVGFDIDLKTLTTSFPE